MKDFRLYDITDFVMDEDFIRWVHEKRSEDETFWNNWLRQHPEKHLVVAEARRIIESIQIEPLHIPEQAVEQEIDKLLQTISTQPAISNPPRRVVKMRLTWWYAAALILLSGTAIWHFSIKPKPRQYVYAAMVSEKKLIEHTNTSQKSIDIALPDGSTLTLAPNSRVSYARSLDTAITRDVYLLGEAFFKVAKHPDRPFRVYANEIVAKVLGTSFTVRSFENDTTIRVIVRTGKVSVYAQSDKPASKKQSEIILTPNQQLVYEKTEQKFQKVLLDNPAVIVPTPVECCMVYNDTPLEKVFEDLSKAYGINIVCDSEVLSKCTVTADLQHEPFYRKLDLICSAIGARYELIDGQVVIHSAGC
jgi:ferric-dicitrate binding protein FerR (iron transport regulator)